MSAIRLQRAGPLGPARTRRSRDALRPLHNAAFGGHLDITRLLLARGLAVNEPVRADGLTALTIASVRDSMDLVRLLLE